MIKDIMNDKKVVEIWIKDDYKKIQNYLNGDPGVEGFIDSLGILEQDLGAYLFETLKTKKYGTIPYNTNVYKKYIKDEQTKQHIESLIMDKIVGNRVSINSLINDGLTRIQELFKIKESFEKVSRIPINNIILPPDTKDPPEYGNEIGYEKRGTKQDKILLFMSILKELGIDCNNGLTIYSGIINNNMIRENTYYAIYIQEIDKTVFLNIGYGEASFVCNGNISQEVMVTYGKDKLQKELGATKIIFPENNIKGWVDNFKTVLLGRGGNVGKKINKTGGCGKKSGKELEENSFCELVYFFQEHKNDEFHDSKGEKVFVRDIFSRSYKYYQQNYKKINEIYKSKLPRNPNAKYNKTRNEIKKGLGINKIYIRVFETMSLEEIKKFYEQHKNDKFIDSSGKESTIEALFSTREYYYSNYEIVNKKYKIFLPCGIIRRYGKTRHEIKAELLVNS